MNLPDKLRIALVLAAWFAVVAVVVWLPTRINYRVRNGKLLVTFFGIPIRWFALDSIKWVGTGRVWFAEWWPNTYFTLSRRLIIRRSRGLFKTLIITPK